MKKTYIQPTTKAVRVRTENQIATISGGGNDTANGTLDSTNSGNGTDALGKEDDLDFGW